MMKHRILLRSLGAAALATLLLIPGVGAAACAMGTECGMALAPAGVEASAHCAGMETSAAPGAPATPDSPHVAGLDCCPEPATLADPVPALARSADSTELQPRVYSASRLDHWSLDVSRALGARSSPTPRSSPPPSGAELRTLHQSFLS